MNQQSQAVYRAVQESALSIRKQFGDPLPTIGLILGTGLGSVENAFPGHSLPYTAIPGFPKTSSESHSGHLYKSDAVFVLSGRVHLYEGRSPAEVCHGVRVLHTLGVKTLIITNASGALNPDLGQAGLLCVKDQINMTGVSPLTGDNNEAMGLRFPDMSCPFDQELIKLADRCANDLRIPLPHGVYIGVHGPELETPAETKMYRMLGADAVGMSSVLEVICARHLNMRVLEISCLTNQNDPDNMQPIVIEDVIKASRDLSHNLIALLQMIIKTLQVS